MVTLKLVSFHVHNSSFTVMFRFTIPVSNIIGTTGLGTGIWLLGSIAQCRARLWVGGGRGESLAAGALAPQQHIQPVGGLENGRAHLDHRLREPSYYRPLTELLKLQN